MSYLNGEIGKFSNYLEDQITNSVCSVACLKIKLKGNLGRYFLIINYLIIFDSF